MPTYEYQCDQCRRIFEIWQRITAEPLTRCEACGGTLRRLLAPAPFILKGEGWYVTDYPSEARKKAAEAEKAPTKGSETKDSASAEKSSTPGETSTPTANGAGPPSTPSPSSS